MVITNWTGDNTITTYTGEDARKELIATAIKLLKSYDKQGDSVVLQTLSYLETALEHARPVVTVYNNFDGALEPGDTFIKD